MSSRRICHLCSTEIYDAQHSHTDCRTIQILRAQLRRAACDRDEAIARAFSKTSTVIESHHAGPDVPFTHYPCAKHPDRVGVFQYGAGLYGCHECKDGPYLKGADK